MELVKRKDNVLIRDEEGIFSCNYGKLKDGTTYAFKKRGTDNELCIAIKDSKGMDQVVFSETDWGMKYDYLIKLKPEE